MTPGCGHTQATRFYTLAAPLAASDLGVPPPPAPPPPAGLPVLSVERVAVAPYLRRPQLVLRTLDSAELVTLDYARWASSLEDEITGALVDALRAQLAGTFVVVPGDAAHGSAPGLALVVERFDAVPGSACRLEARWSLGPAPAATAHFDTLLADADPSAIAAAHRANLLALAEHLASLLKSRGSPR